MKVENRKSRRHDVDSGRQTRPEAISDWHPLAQKGMPCDDDNMPSNEHLATAPRRKNPLREAWMKSPQRAYAVDSKPRKSIHAPEDAEMDHGLPLHERNEEE